MLKRERQEVMPSNFTHGRGIYRDANPTNWRPTQSMAQPILTPAESGSAGQADILILQYLANVTSADQTLVVVPERVLVFLLLAPALPVIVRRKRKRRKV